MAREVCPDAAAVEVEICYWEQQRSSHITFSFCFTRRSSRVNCLALIAHPIPLRLTLHILRTKNIHLIGTGLVTLRFRAVYVYLDTSSQRQVEDGSREDQSRPLGKQHQMSRTRTCENNHRGSSSYNNITIAKRRRVLFSPCPH